MLISEIINFLAESKEDIQIGDTVETIKMGQMRGEVVGFKKSGGIEKVIIKGDDGKTYATVPDNLQKVDNPEIWTDADYDYVMQNVPPEEPKWDGNWDDSWDAKIGEAKPSKKDCRKPAEKLSASWLSSCKSRGLKARDGAKTHIIGGKKVSIRGKKIRGSDYGGPRFG